MYAGLDKYSLCLFIPEDGDFFMADDRLYEAMVKKALGLARRGEGYTTPNPIVGAVVFNRDGIIATGYHKKAGGPHAEREAIERAGDRARGASIAVNLEPCCHIGRTGPCTDIIIRAGIKEVVYSIDDPNPKVNCKGARTLKDNGIRVINGIFKDEATRINEVYLKYITTGRPFVVLKMAQSLDGRLAAAGGDSQWISGEKALDFAHRLRARYDAVAVGTGTVRADNPQLTVRRVRGKNPYRIIVTTSADLSATLKLFADNGDHKTIVATTPEVIDSGIYSSVTTWPIDKNGDNLDLDKLLTYAGGEEISSILFEGGSRLATSLLKQNLIDKFYLVLAPMVIGRGIAAVGDLGITKVSRAVRFAESGFKKMGTDTLFWGYPKQ